MKITNVNKSFYLGQYFFLHTSAYLCRYGGLESKYGQLTKLIPGYFTISTDLTNYTVSVYNYRGVAFFPNKRTEIRSVYEIKLN